MSVGKQVLINLMMKSQTGLISLAISVILTLSMLHVTIISPSYLVEKVPLQELFSAQSLA